MIRCVVHRAKSAQGPGCVGLVLGFIHSGVGDRCFQSLAEEFTQQ